MTWSIYSKSAWDRYKLLLLGRKMMNAGGPVVHRDEEEYISLCLRLGKQLDL